MKAPKIYLPLEQEVRADLLTEGAAFHLNRRPQTLRGWNCHDDGPVLASGLPLRARSVNGLLHWPTADVRELCGVAGPNGTARALTEAPPRRGVGRPRKVDPTTAQVTT